MKNNATKERLFEIIGRLDKTFKPKLNESPMNVVTNDAGEPIGTEEQPDNFESQEDDYQNDRPQQRKGIGNFNHIDWQMLHEQLIINTELQAAHKTSDGNLMTANAGDFTDDEGMLSSDELNLLEEYDLVYIHDGLPIIENEQYKDLNVFKAKAQEIWNKELQSYNLAGGHKQVHETTAQTTNIQQTDMQSPQTQYADSTYKMIAPTLQRIRTVDQFPMAFKGWFSTLGYKPQSSPLTIAQVRLDVEQVMRELGYK